MGRAQDSKALGLGLFGVQSHFSHQSDSLCTPIACAMGNKILALTPPPLALASAPNPQMQSAEIYVVMLCLGFYCRQQCKHYHIACPACPSFLPSPFCCSPPLGGRSNSHV